MHWKSILLRKPEKISAKKIREITIHSKKFVNSYLNTITNDKKNCELYLFVSVQ